MLNPIKTWLGGKRSVKSTDGQIGKAQVCENSPPLSSIMPRLFLLFLRSRVIPSPSSVSWKRPPDCWST
jgi:hypothetical protein